MINSAICNILENNFQDVNIQECFDEMFSGLSNPVLSGIFLTLLKEKNDIFNDISPAINSAKNTVKKISLNYDCESLIENICLNQNEKYLDISFAMDIICSANDIGAVKSIPYNYCYKNNSFNTLKTFGINIEKLTVENFEKTKLLFSYIDKDNAYIKYTQELFRILPFESILNTVNYFLNPYNTKNCTIALNDKNKVEKFAQICLNLGYSNSIVFSSGDFPYVSIEDKTYICEAWKNKIFSYTLNCELLEIEKLEMLIQNAKNIVLNVDDGFHINFTGGSKKNLITYGFNSKASITISSVTEDEALICVQRNISNKNGTIEIQEVKFENSNNYNIYDLIIFFILFILYFPCDSSDCKNVIK